MTNTTIFKQLSSLVFGACVMSMLTSCGNSTSGGGQSPKQGRKNPIEQPEEALGLTGRYVVKFKALNSSVAGVTNAIGKIQIVGDQITVDMDVKDSPATTNHSQMIYSANECPTEAHDTNNDGFIDPIEASKVLGQILIPLDADLNSQFDGIQEFPTSNFMGTYTYYKEGVLSSLIADLQAPDADEKDELTKLKSSEELKLEGKVIVIQGVSNDIYVPGSVRTFNGASDRATLSIACGKITRVMLEDSETSSGEAQYE
jgi:hypothetical protein